METYYIDPHMKSLVHLLKNTNCDDWPLSKESLKEHKEWGNETLQKYDNLMEPVREPARDICPECKIQMDEYEHDQYKWCCPICGRVIDMNISYWPTSYGYEYSSEIKKIPYNYEKHFIDWINHILARDKIPRKLEESLDVIRNYVIQKNITRIIPEDVRKTLKELKLSKYYKHTSYIFKELTGVKPPEIPEVLLYQARRLFLRFIKAREAIIGLRPNNPQYSYLIYKFCDVILPPDDEENRRIFHFIHLPSIATLNKREQEWKLICEKLEINYKPII